MSRQPEWDAYRYVLNDPTLDRLAFEARMLEDMDLAMAVAEAVSHIDALRAASFIAQPESTNAVEHARPAATADSGWHWTSLAGLAAGLLAAIAAVNYQIASYTTQRSLAGTQIQSNSGKLSLAESWLAIRQTELVDVSSSLVDVSSNFELSREEAVAESAELIASEASVEDDWLMDAAREFYAQGEAG